MQDSVGESDTRGTVNATTVAAYVSRLMPDAIGPPERIEVQQVSPVLYAVRVYETRGGEYEAFFVAINDEGEVVDKTPPG